MERALNACEIKRVVNHCAEWSDRNPTVGADALRCDPADYCRHNALPRVAEAMRCWGKMREGSKDFFKDLKESLVITWKHVRQVEEDREAFAVVCNQSLACKRQLVQGIPQLETLSDEALEKYTASYLMAKADLLANNQAAMIRHSVIGPDHEIPAPDLTPAQADQLSALWETSREILLQKYQQFACLSEEAQDDLQCHSFGLLMSWTVARGTLSQFFRVERLEKVLATDAKSTSGVQEFVAKYLNYSSTTKEENLRWIAMAKATDDSDGTFFDVENASMKNLNSSLESKNLVTSLTNFHKYLVQEKLENLEKEFGLTVLSPERIDYSDFKSIRAAFQGQGPPDLESKLAKAFSEANDEFVSYVKEHGLVPAGMSPETWFRSGMGGTADQATRAARFARKSEDNKLVNFASPEVQKTLQEDLSAVEQTRQSLEKRLMGTSVMDSTSGGSPTLSAEAFDILKKDGEDLAKAQSDLKSHFGLSELPMSTVKQMKTYAEQVDEFSPGIHVDERLRAHLDDAVQGGVSFDAIGMGAHNAKATAEALTRAKTVNESLLETRRGEEKVTAMFSERKEKAQEIIKDVVGRDRVHTVCSGDDCVAIPNQPLSASEKKQILQKMAQSGYGSQFRLSFIPDQVREQVWRNQLSVHGEELEKILRNRLRGQMEPGKLKSLIFGVDMQTRTLNQGAVQLLWGQSSEVRLTNLELKMIQENFQAALKEFNETWSAKGTPVHYVVASP